MRYRSEVVVGKMTCEIGSESYAELVQVFEQRRNRLVRAAQRITHSQEDAEDVVQDAALKALIHLDRFRGDSRIETWLCAIINNVALSRLRSPSWRREISMDSTIADGQTLLSCMHSGGSLNPERSYERRELQEVVWSEIHRLKDTYREAIQLCDYEGRSYVEAADELHLKLPKFKARLYRGRRVLRQRICKRILANQR
jgi:RNA polymerase sigma-70 factor (ECF subfamily)